jgi:hypothetical protein
LNVQNAIDFVENNGTVIERYRLNFLLGKERNDRIPLEYLKDLQNNDGSFPYGNKKGRLGCINATDVNLGLIVELGLENSDVSRKAVDYLLKVQRSDGSWVETEEIERYGPPFWDMPNDLNTAIWLTVNTASLLMQLGCRNSEVDRKATEFLLRNRDGQGKFTGFLLSTMLSVGLFGQLGGGDSDTVKKALKILEKNVKKLDPAWCLESLYVAGIPEENPVVRKCIEKLVASQEDGGSWKSENGKKFTTCNTINALKALRKYRIW